MSLTKAQLEQKLKVLEAQLATQQNAINGGLIVKKNNKGGLFIRHTSFKEWSTKHDKEYVAGINMNFNTAKALFNNPELLEQIKDLLNGIE